MAARGVSKVSVKAVGRPQGPVKRLRVARTLRFALLAAGAACVAASPAGAVVNLGSTAGVGAPKVIVDATGQGYTTWAAGGTAHNLDYCRLTTGKPRCASRQSFSYPAATQSEDSGNAPVFTAGGSVALVDSRCCLLSNQKFLYTSSDGGQTFGPPTELASDEASGMDDGNVLDVPAGALFAGSPEQVITSDNGSVGGGGSIQATGLTASPADPGWFSPPLAGDGTLSESIAREGSTMVVVYTQDTVPHYTVTWVKYSGVGDPNAASSWSAPQGLSPLPSLDSNAQLVNGFNGIFVARSIARPGDNEALAVQRFTGSGWTSPVIVTKTELGAKFAIDETPAGVVYVIWEDTSGKLDLVQSANALATKFGKVRSLPTGHTTVDSPAIAVDAAGTGWATWIDDSSKGYAVPIHPVPTLTTLKLSDGGTLTLVTPGGCVTPGKAFDVSLGFEPSKHKHSVYLKVTHVVFSATGAPSRTTRRAPSRTRLTPRTSTRRGSSLTVAASARIKLRHGKPRTKSITTKVPVCP
jgi:hypothetical protein